MWGVTWRRAATRLRETSRMAPERLPGLKRLKLFGLNSTGTWVEFDGAGPLCLRTGSIRNCVHPYPCMDLHSRSKRPSMRTARDCQPPLALRLSAVPGTLGQSDPIPFCDMELRGAGRFVTQQLSPAQLFASVASAQTDDKCSVLPRGSQMNVEYQSLPLLGSFHIIACETNRERGHF